MVPVMPLSFELACELSFPVGEAIAAGILVTGGQLIGIIIVNFDIYIYIYLMYRYLLIHFWMIQINNKILSLFLSQALYY